MPLLTLRELDSLRSGEGAKPSGPVEVPEAAPVPVPPAEGRVRMHHPDSVDSAPITCSFELDGAEVSVIRGVATVPFSVAEKLESRGWLRGSEVKE